LDGCGLAVKAIWVSQPLHFAHLLVGLGFLPSGPARPAMPAEWGRRKAGIRVPSAAPGGRECRADADHKLLQSPGEMLCSHYVLWCLTSISNSDGARVLAIAIERTLAKRRCCRRAQLSATCDAPDSRLPACVLGRPHKGCRQDACNPAARRTAARLLLCTTRTSKKVRKNEPIHALFRNVTGTPSTHPLKGARPDGLGRR